MRLDTARRSGNGYVRAASHTSPPKVALLGRHTAMRRPLAVQHGKPSQRSTSGGSLHERGAIGHVEGDEQTGDVKLHRLLGDA